MTEAGTGWRDYVFFAKDGLGAKECKSGGRGVKSSSAKNSTELLGGLFFFRELSAKICEVDAWENASVVWFAVVLLESNNLWWVPMASPPLVVWNLVVDAATSKPLTKLALLDSHDLPPFRRCGERQSQIL